MGGVQFTVWGLRLPSLPPPAPPEPPAPLPFVGIKLSPLCKPVPASPGLKGRLFPGLQNGSLAPCWQPKPIIDKLGGGHLAAGRCSVLKWRRGTQGLGVCRWVGVETEPAGLEARSIQMVSVKCNVSGRRF